MAWYMVWLREIWHGILYGLANMAWYMITPGEVWDGIWKCLCEFHCLGLWSLSHVEKPISVGGLVHTKRDCYMHVPFTRTAPVQSVQ